MEQLKGKVALVTGAASGIGKATALAFANEGAKVVVADVQDELGAKAVEQIKAQGGEACYIHCDVSDPEAVKAMVAETVKTYGGLHFAFNNAGTEGEQAFTADCTLENWDRVIDINLKGVFLCMKYQISELLKSGGGAIVNCSSIAGKVGFPGIPAYEASKHGVIGLTQNAALEYAKQNIRVNAVCPGPIKTPMIDRFTHGDPQAAEQLTMPDPMGRMGEPEEISGAVVWLCSNQASYITGHALVIDGGWVVQ